MKRKGLLFIAGIVFLAGILSGIILLGGGTQKESIPNNKVTERVETASNDAHVKVSLLPFADFSQKETIRLKQDLEKHLSILAGEVTLEFEVLPNKPLAAEWKNNAGTRYRADKMINALAKDANKQHVIVGLTHKDVSVPYKGKADWGVLGLSLIPKKACVVSTFRVKNRKDLWKVVSHEFIHTCFEYQHCPDNNPKCLMKDAKGHADFSNKSTLCEKCSKRYAKAFTGIAK